MLPSPPGQERPALPSPQVKPAGPGHQGPVRRLLSVHLVRRGQVGRLSSLTSSAHPL